MQLFNNPKTPNFALPLLVTAQAQKELIHNEALIIIDAILNSGLETIKPMNKPKLNPAEGECYLIGDNPQAKWKGKGEYITFFYNGWRFIKPKAGLRLWVKDVKKLYVFDESKWIELKQLEKEADKDKQQNKASKLTDLTDVEINNLQENQIIVSNIVNSQDKKFTNSNLNELLDKIEIKQLAINTTKDPNNGLSVKSDNVLFTEEKGDCKIKVNKKTKNNTASFIFQTNWQARAEFGLIGEDNFVLKIFPDGVNSIEIFKIDLKNGAIDFKQDVTIRGKKMKTE